jgi:hypothetical protein
MPEPHVLAPEAEAQIGALGSADLVVAVAADGGEDAEPALAAMRAGLLEHFEGLHAVLLYIHAAGKSITPVSGVPVLDLPIAVGSALGPRAAAPRLALEASRRLRARGAAVVSTEVSTLHDGWLDRLLGPVLRQETDLVLPYYHRHPFSGVVTSGILYPLIRALYGKRIRYPLGADFACSARLAEKQLGSEGSKGRQTAHGLELRLITSAVAGGLPIRQARLGHRASGAADSGLTPGAILSAVVSPAFAEMERTAPVWQKIRGSVPVEAVGEEDPSEVEPVPVDGRRLLEAFRLGQQNLPEVWGLVLPPGTLVELKRIARLPDQEFRIPDPVWARIVYDFSLAHRTRIISRDHLMGALAPLYLGWFGSLHAEMGGSDTTRLEQRLEQLCLSFEAEKPYLISRWRWPDRFNP